MENEETVEVLRITKAMDLLPPRPMFPGTRLFSICCKPKAYDDNLNQACNDNNDNDSFSLASKLIPESKSRDGTCLLSVMRISFLKWFCFEHFLSHHLHFYILLFFLAFMEDIPNLESFSSISDDEWADSSSNSSSSTGFRKRTGRRELVPSPRSLKDASNFLLEFCQILFAMLIVDKTFGGNIKHRKRR